MRHRLGAKDNLCSGPWKLFLFSYPWWLGNIRVCVFTFISMLIFPWTQSCEIKIVFSNILWGSCRQSNPQDCNKNTETEWLGCLSPLLHVCSTHSSWHDRLKREMSRVEAATEGEAEAGLAEGWSTSSAAGKKILYLLGLRRCYLFLKFEEHNCLVTVRRFLWISCSLILI